MEEKSVRDMNEEIICMLKELNTILEKVLEEKNEEKRSTAFSSGN